MEKRERGQGSEVLKELGNSLVTEEEQNIPRRQIPIGNPETMGHRKESSY